MPIMNFRIEHFLLRVMRPTILFIGVLFYALGVGIAHYLGISVKWGIVIIGQIWITTFQLSLNFLSTLYLSPSMPGDQTRLQINDDGEEPIHYIRRDLILSGIFATFVVLAMLTFLLIRSQEVDGTAYLIMGIMVISLFCLTMPPLQIVKTGYGEIIEAILMANMIPGLAFILQFGELHRLVAMTTFPLTLLFLAMVLATSLQNFATDIKKGTKNLLTTLGWQRGMLLHNLLILCTYLLFTISMLFGLSPRVILPVFFVLPLGLFQIWYMLRIASGVKPNWRMLNMTAFFTFFLSVYLITFSFWLR
jgi:1,4-dihydroxy-2-naphthoate octaprenyltransferase